MLRLVTSTLISRSLVPLRASLFVRHQCYATREIDDFLDESWLKSQMNMWPEISSMLFHMEKTGQGRSLTLNIPGVEKMETDEGQSCVSLDMPGLKKEDMKACVEHNTLFIQGKTHNECYLAGIKLQDIKLEHMKDGKLKATIPNKLEEFKNDNILDPWPYSDIFSDLSILGKGFCPLIAKLSPINSFSIYKDQTAKSRLHMNLSMPGQEKMKLTTQGVRVSLYMPGLKLEDVKSFFDYDTFFIEGKTVNEHYITGIHLPEGIHKNHSMIKIRMKGGMYHATLPYICEKAGS